MVSHLTNTVIVIVARFAARRTRRRRRSQPQLSLPDGRKMRSWGGNFRGKSTGGWAGKFLCRFQHQAAALECSSRMVRGDDDEKMRLFCPRFVDFATAFRLRFSISKSRPGHRSALGLTWPPAMPCPFAVSGAGGEDELHRTLARFVGRPRFVTWNGPLHLSCSCLLSTDRERKEDSSSAIPLALFWSFAAFVFIKKLSTSRTRATRDTGERGSLFNLVASNSTSANRQPRWWPYGPYFPSNEPRGNAEKGAYERWPCFMPRLPVECESVTNQLESADMSGSRPRAIDRRFGSLRVVCVLSRLTHTAAPGGPRPRVGLLI